MSKRRIHKKYQEPFFEGWKISIADILIIIAALILITILVM
ncbi:hypothetical protein [Empedobacter tilapiae]|nr:hypothetical protein [Empedobacter tilapiae]